jgi:hypothetical protein
MTEKAAAPIGYAAWTAEAVRLFGPKIRDWRFVCPVCGTVQSALDFAGKTALTRDEISPVLGFSCIGRWAEGMGCDYAGGGLFKLNSIAVRSSDGTIHRMFDFDRSGEADADLDAYAAMRGWKPYEGD